MPAKDEGFRHPKDRPKKPSRMRIAAERGFVPALFGIEQEDVPGLVPAGRAIKNVVEGAIEKVSGARPTPHKKRPIRRR